MVYRIDDFSYGSGWDTMSIDTHSRYGPRMSDYHMHSYYEISLITSGDVTVFLSDVSDSGTHCRIVLLRPHTPHFITADPSTLYSRTNLLFSNEFVADYVPEWSELSELFGANGNIITLSDEECKRLQRLISDIDKENNHFRKRLMLLCFLSTLGELPKGIRTSTPTPNYIITAVNYLTENYAGRITAKELADIAGVGRTTLMTGFKKYIGTTVNEYITQCRLKHAIKLMRAGATVEDAAVQCGYADGCCLIRVFKNRFKVTPTEYIGKKHR